MQSSEGWRPKKTFITEFLLKLDPPPVFAPALAWPSSPLRFNRRRATKDLYQRMTFHHIASFVLRDQNNLWIFEFLSQPKIREESTNSECLIKGFDFTVWIKLIMAQFSSFHRGLWVSQSGIVLHNWDINHVTFEGLQQTNETKTLYIV